MLRPGIKHLFLKRLEIKYKPEQYMHLDHILTQDDFLELCERQLIKSETYQIRKDRKKGRIVFSICHCRMQIKNYVIGRLEKTLVPFSAVKYLFEEDPFGVFTFECAKKLSGMRIGCHYVFVKRVDEFNAFGDELVVLHCGIYIVTAVNCIVIVINFFLVIVL